MLKSKKETPESKFNQGFHLDINIFAAAEQNRAVEIIFYILSNGRSAQ